MLQRLAPAYDCAPNGRWRRRLEKGIALIASIAFMTIQGVPLQIVTASLFPRPDPFSRWYLHVSDRSNMVLLSVPKALALSKRICRSIGVRVVSGDYDGPLSVSARPVNSLLKVKIRSGIASSGGI